jgi:hypothetical protein
MTIATAYAYRGEDLGAIGVMADSRLSWRDGAYADMAVKTHELDSRTIAATAGLGMVGITAAELTRSLIAQTDAHSGRPPGLWLSVRAFAHFAKLIREELRSANEQRGGPDVPDNEFAIAGFYEDGSPGVATLIMGKNRSSATFMRPHADAELACVVIGESSVKDLVYATYLEAAKKHADFHEDVASTLWYLICAESASASKIPHSERRGRLLRSKESGSTEVFRSPRVTYPPIELPPS